MRLRDPPDRYPPRGGTQRVRKAAGSMEFAAAPPARKIHLEQQSRPRWLLLGDGSHAPRRRREV